MKNSDLYNRALHAIRDLFDDRSVSQQQARDNLRNLQEVIDVLDCSLGTIDEGDDDEQIS